MGPSTHDIRGVPVPGPDKTSGDVRVVDLVTELLSYLLTEHSPRLLTPVIHKDLPKRYGDVIDVILLG